MMPSSFQDSNEDENVNYIGLELTIVGLPSESSSPAFGRSSVDATTTQGKFSDKPANSKSVVTLMYRRVHSSR